MSKIQHHSKLVYYNEFDPFAAAWLRKLISEGLIPAGDVDERSITEVKPDDLRGYTQCHWFAGIGGWSEALRLANWPTDRPVWTGSCPCQPFSTAGNRKGRTDERHLWPIWFELIRELRPPVVFGEQVASAITHGWWDDVARDLEGEGYACGAAIIPACSVGKPHKRERLWFVGDAEHDGYAPLQESGSEGQTIQHNEERKNSSSEPTGASSSSDVADTAEPRLPQWGRGQVGKPEAQSQLERLCEGDVADPECERQQGPRPVGKSSDPEESSYGQADQFEYAGARLQWIDCPDGKQRAIEPSIRLLAHGVPNRVGLLRGFGNAIVPQVAAKFITAYMEI